MSALADDVAPAGHGSHAGYSSRRGDSGHGRRGHDDRAEAATAHIPPACDRALEALRRTSPVSFEYPLEGQASVLLDLGRAVPGGRRPKRRASSRTASSASTWAARSSTGAAARVRLPVPSEPLRPRAPRVGIVQGVAMPPLPRVLPARSKTGAVWAVGVDGLIYGYRNNLHPGKRVGGKK